MWLMIVVGILGLGIGFGGGYLFFQWRMESAHERGNLAKKISALPYVILEFLDQSKFKSLSADNKVDFITEFFRKELKNLNVAAYTPVQPALDDFYKRHRLNRAPQATLTSESAAH